MTQAAAVPTPGQIARIRQRTCLVEEVVKPRRSPDSTLVRLSCVDDDNQGQPLEVLWEKGLDPTILTGEAWEAIAAKGFDDSRLFGGWSQLITLFRLVYEGGQHGKFKIPARKGYLFDPDRYRFLEGGGKLSVVSSQLSDSPTTDNRRLTTPRISDGVIYRVLRNLLILDGERLSYRTLDVEQIGSVYETVMGFNLEVAAGKSIAIKPVKSHGAPATINLEALSGSARANHVTRADLSRFAVHGRSGVRSCRGCL